MTLCYCSSEIKIIMTPKEMLSVSTQTFPIQYFFNTENATSHPCFSLIVLSLLLDIKLFIKVSSYVIYICKKKKKKEE